MRRPLRFLGPLFLVTVAIAAYGFLQDNAPVVAAAQARACEGRGPRCSASLVRLFRTPIFQDLRFALSSRQEVDVRCVRVAYLVGDYRCTRR